MQRATQMRCKFSAGVETSDLIGAGLLLRVSAAAVCSTPFIDRRSTDNVYIAHAKGDERSARESDVAKCRSMFYGFCLGNVQRLRDI